MYVYLYTHIYILPESQGQGRCKRASRVLETPRTSPPPPHHTFTRVPPLLTYTGVSSSVGTTFSHLCRVTLLTRNSANLGPYSRAMPRVLWCL